MPLWFSKKLLLTIEKEFLRAPMGEWAGIGIERLAKNLERRGQSVENISEDVIKEGAFAGIVLHRASSLPQWQDSFFRMNKSLLSSGVLIALDKGAPSEASRRFLCSGFTDLHQIMVSGQIITSGVCL